MTTVSSHLWIASRMVHAVLCAICITISGCSLIKARPAEDAGFLPNPELLKDLSERAPFHAAYISDEKRIEDLRVHYTKVHIEPVVTTLAEEKLKKRNLPDSIIADRIEDLRELARYFEGKIRVAFEEFDPTDVDADVAKKGPIKKFQVVDVPTDDTFVWQLAIIDISPNSPELNIAATAAGFFVPGTGAVRALGSGSIAIEGIVRDGKTGDVLCEFRDREADKTAPVSIRDYQMYAHIRRALDEWAEQFAELAGTPMNHQVSDSLPFTLNPF
jgi:hypothetical protein